MDSDGDAAFERASAADNTQDADSSTLSVSVEVELLCRAHYCFVLVCSMDVIDTVLSIARARVPKYVELGRFNPLVKLLTQIKRFREMEYVLDMLILHEKFELLLGKDVMQDDHEGRVELKMALRVRQ